MLQSSSFVSRAVACVAALFAAGCRGPEPDFYVQRVVALGGDRPAIALQWDSSELRHPRVDLFSFDGTDLVADYGMVLPQVRPVQIVAATSSPSRVLVQTDSSGALFATGPDGFVLSNSFALWGLAPIRGGFVGQTFEPGPVESPSRTTAVLVSVDERARERWRTAQRQGTVFCSMQSLLTPDGTRVAVVVSDAERSCSGETTLRVYNDQGTLVAEHARDAIANLGALTPLRTAVRNDLVTLTIAKATVENRAQGFAIVHRPGERAPMQLNLGGFVPAIVAPVGESRWLLVGQSEQHIERMSGRTTYTTIERSYDAWIVDDAGARSWQTTLVRNVTPVVNVTSTSRGTLLLSGAENNGRPRWIAFAPDGRVLRDERLDLEAHARMVQPPLEAASP